MELKTNIYQKLLSAKKEIGAISKDSTNPFYKSKYFDINKLVEQVEPILQKHSLLLLQPIKENKVISQIFDVDNSTCVESFIELPNITDPQKLGSAITYYRRYTLQSLLGLQAEDDDANIAVKYAKPVKPKLTDERFANALKAIKEGKAKVESLDKFELTSNQLNQLK